MLKHYYIFLFLFTFLGLSAQDMVQMEEHELSTVNNPWLQVDNAAGLGLSNVKPHGVTELGYYSESGSYHRAQQGDKRAGLNFYSERYDKIGKNWTSWGSFNFVMDREKNRAWSDVFSTYNNNPYIFGSSIPGNYDRQLFDFRIKLSSIEKGRLTYGVGINYLVGDLSRLRDPRSRVFLADYAVLPSLTFRLSKNHRLGMNLKAVYRKEKMPNVTTVNESQNPKYYTFLGMENVNAITGGFIGFQRQYLSNIYGGELQYAFKSDYSELLVAGGGHYEQQQILENLKQSPGSYEAVNYKLRIAGKTITNGKMINFSVAGTMKSGTADEFIQKLVSTNTGGVNSQNWVTLFTYKNRYINTAYSTLLSFILRNINAQINDYSWLVGIETGLTGFKYQYNLPYSEFTANRINAALTGHYRLLNKNNNRLTLNAKIEFITGVKNILQLSEDATVAPAIDASTFKQGMYDVATNVYIPDLNYFNATAYNTSIESKYSLPLIFKKSRFIGYAKISYNYLSTNTDKSRSGAALSIGIIP